MFDEIKYMARFRGPYSDWRDREIAEQEARAEKAGCEQLKQMHERILRMMMASFSGRSHPLQQQSLFHKNKHRPDVVAKETK